MQIVSDEFNPMMISVTDDDGVEYELEIIDEIDYNGEHYMAMLPSQQNPNLIVAEPEELMILKVAYDENCDEIFVTIDDDAEADEVTDIFVSRLEGLYDIDEADE